MPPVTSVQLMLLLGPTLPVPAPEVLARAVERVEVTHSDQGASGFQIVFRAGRGAPYNLVDYPLLRSRLLKPLTRVVLVVRVGAIPQVLFDGVITHQQLDPGAGPGAGIITVTGEDLTALMDLEEKSAPHPAQSEPVIVAKILATYARYGLVPMVIPPTTLDQPLPVERIPVQRGSDLSYLRQLARRFAYDFYLTPGPLPGMGQAYWGPPRRLQPQSALTVQMGAFTNVNSISFSYDALGPQRVEGELQDRQTARVMPIVTTSPARPPLAREPARPRRVVLAEEVPGLSMVAARARAQARVDEAADAVTAQGELDGLRYGRALMPRRLVGVRGVGDSYDGLYYVRQVTHVIEQGAYRQRFSLAREGTGSLTPALLP